MRMTNLDMVFLTEKLNVRDIIIFLLLIEEKSITDNIRMIKFQF